MLLRDDANRKVGGRSKAAQNMAESADSALAREMRAGYQASAEAEHMAATASRRRFFPQQSRRVKPPERRLRAALGKGVRRGFAPCDRGRKKRRRDAVAAICSASAEV